MPNNARRYGDSALVDVHRSAVASIQNVIQLTHSIEWAQQCRQADDCSVDIA